ncbi:hypothetical protein GF319_05030, partial [Candidatus Bathyarchaeota archaeon]|nr:hypothetical protein [Candidatus Bathyarchaeota archaeon]
MKKTLRIVLTAYCLISLVFSTAQIKVPATDQIIEDPDDYQKIDTSNGNHYGDYSFLQKWGMIHEQYSDTADTSKIEYDTLGVVEKTEVASYNTGIDVDAKEVNNVRYDDEGNIESYDYCDGSECYHVDNIGYDKDGNVIKYRITSSTGEVTYYYDISYNSDGEIISFTRESDDEITVHTITRDDEGNITGYEIQEIEGKGKKEAIREYAISDIVYDYIGRVYGLKYLNTQEYSGLNIHVSKMGYNDYGQLVSYEENTTDTDSGLVISITRRTLTEYDSEDRILRFNETRLELDVDENIFVGNMTVTVYEYDKFGRVTGRSQASCSSTTPSLETTYYEEESYDSQGRKKEEGKMVYNLTSGLALYVSFNIQGLVDEKILVDQQTGIMADVVDLRRALAVMGGDEDDDEALIELFMDLVSGDIVDLVPDDKKGEDQGNR